MSWRRLRWVLPLVLLAAAGLILLLVRKPLSDREQIAQLIQRIESSIEKKDLGGITSCVSKDYRDDYGITRRDILRLAFRYVRSADQAEILISDASLRLQHDMASASMHVDVEYAEQGGQLTRVSGDVTLFLEKEGGRWVIVRSSGWQSRLDVE